MFVIVIKRGLVVGLHDLHVIEYAITCSFSFLSSCKLGLWRIFGVEQMPNALFLRLVLYWRGGGGKGLEVCVFPGR